MDSPSPPDPAPEPDAITILVDADACPVKDEVERVASRRLGLASGR